MIKDNSNNISQTNTNRARLSIFNFQSEINSLLEQQEFLENENSDLKQRLIQKNEDLLLRITNNLPKSYTDNFLVGLKNQSLHLNYVGDIAMSDILNDQFEATCQKQTQTDLANLRSIIHIQKEKLKMSESKIIELNDFIRQQDSLLTQTKELLKAKCQKIQMLDDQIQHLNEINHQIQQQSKDKTDYQPSRINNLEEDEDEFDFAFQNEDTRKSNLRGISQQGVNSCSLSPSGIIENPKENIHSQYQIPQQISMKYQDCHSIISSQKFNEINSQRVLQNNKSIINISHSNEKRQSNISQNSHQNQQEQNSYLNKISIENNENFKYQEKRINSIENIIRNSKASNSPTLSLKPNNHSQSIKPLIQDQFEQRGRFQNVNQENEGYNRFNQNVEEAQNKQQSNQNFNNQPINTDSYDQNNKINTGRSLKERSNSMKQLNQYIQMKQINQYGVQAKQQNELNCNNDKILQQNNYRPSSFERSPTQIILKKDMYRIPASNRDITTAFQYDEGVNNKSNRSIGNNYNSSVTTESDFNVSYFLNQKLQQRYLQGINNDFPRQQQQYCQQNLPQTHQLPLQLNNNRIISNVINNFQKGNENKQQDNDNNPKVNYQSNQTLNDQSNQSLFSNINISNVFDLANANNSNYVKPLNMSTQKTFNSINNQSQQQIQQLQQNQNQKQIVQNGFSQNLQNIVGQSSNSKNILATLDTDPNIPSSNRNNYNNSNNLFHEDNIRSKSNQPYINSQQYQEKIPLSNHNRQKSGSNYFNIYDQKCMNVQQIGQDQHVRRLSNFSIKNDQSNQKSMDQLDNNLRNSQIGSSNNIYHIQSFNSNSVIKTEMTPHKRQNSQSNGRRRSRAERIQKSTSSLKIYASNDYNTFNPLN